MEESFVKEVSVMGFSVLPVVEMEHYQVPKAARILKGVLEAQSPWLSDISQAMPGNPEASDNAIQRFLHG